MSLRTITNIFAIILTTLAICPVVAVAQDDDLPDASFSLCNWGDLAPERLMGGNWTMNVSQFLVLTANTPTYMGRAESGVVEIDHANGEFLLRGLPAPLPVVQLSDILVSDEPWVWRGDPNLNGNISSADLEILFDCPIENFPRLEGYFETQSQDGHLMSHTMQFVVVSSTHLLGYWRWQSQVNNSDVIRLGGVRLTRDTD